MTTFRFAVFAILAFFLVASTATAQAYNFRGFLWTAAGGVHDLGLPADWTSSSATGISNTGHIVGYLLNGNTDTETAAAWNPETGWQPLNKGVNEQDSLAWGVNDSGQIVGVTSTDGTTQHAFLWTSTDGMQDLGTLGGDFSQASAINNAGEVVGESTTEAGLYHAFLWTQAGGMQDLGTLGGDFGEALTISDNGVIAGTSSATDNVSTAVLWRGGKIRILSAQNGKNSNASGINKSGMVVGWYFPSDLPYHAFLWSQAGGLQDLGVLAGDVRSMAAGINDSGVVVGSCETLDGSESQAFIWTSAGGMQPVRGVGGPFFGATAINDSEQIVGYYATN